MASPHALIIDDQLPNIDVLALLLQQEGFEHTPVTRKRDVIPALDNLPPLDVIFLDLEMPNGDYYSLLHELKADDRLSGVPIVAYTVHVSEIDEARLAGFDHFLGKPLQSQEFPEQLRRILQGEPVWVY